MDLFLRAKAWVLFLFSWGIPVIIMLSGSILGILIDPELLITIIFAIPIFMILTMATMLGWMWSICKSLQHALPESVSVNLPLLSLALLIPFIYICFISIAITPGNLYIFDYINSGPSLLLLVSVHVLSMIGIFFGVYQTARTIKSIQLGKQATFNDFLGEFFMIWFFPVGIWSLQPKVNEIIANKRL